MGKKLVIGSRNQGKIREFRNLLGDEEDLKIFSWRDYDSSFCVKEDGKTFRENAYKKAESTARITGEISIADDSGLEVDFLQGAPGIFSARYAGPEANDEKNNLKLLRALSGVPVSRRGARFVAVIVICSPEGRWDWVEGQCRGVITESPKGCHGFGYDPIFFIPKLGKTFAELNPEEKNRMSHRARAVNRLRPLLKKYLPYK